MKVGIVAIHPFHGSLGTMEVISQTSKHLTQKGIEIHIFTPFENNSSKQNLFVHKLPSTFSRFGLENQAYSLGRKLYSSPTLAKNFLLNKKAIEKTVAQLTKSLLSQTKKIQLDVLQGEQDLPALACLNLGKHLGVPVVAHLRNFWPEECVEIGLINRQDAAYKVLHENVGKSSVKLTEFLQ